MFDQTLFARKHFRFQAGLTAGLSQRLRMGFGSHHGITRLIRPQSCSILSTWVAALSANTW